MLQGAQNLFDELNRGIKTIRLKINKYLEQLSKETMRDIEMMSSQLKLIENAGYCGIGALMRAFSRAVGVFERRLWLWFSLPQLTSSQLKQFELDEEYIKRFISDLIDSTFPFQGSQTFPEVNNFEKNDKTVNLQISGDLERLREAHEYLYGLTRMKNIKKALDLYRYEAEVNLSQNAYNVLAQLYREGDIVEKDLKISLEYSLKSAQANNPIGLYWYSNAILKNQNELDQVGINFVNDTERIKEGLKLLKQAAQSDLAEALTDLAILMEQGITNEKSILLLEPDPNMAIELHFQACQTINSRSYYYYAMNCLKQKERYQQAINLLEESVELGYGPAYYQLGLCYLKGIGVIENEEKALDYIKKGATELFDRDCVEKYTEYIIEKFNTVFTTPESIIFAYDFLREAIRRVPDYPNILYAFGIFHESGSLSKIEKTMAFKYFKQGAELDHLECIIQVARCYYNGVGTQENLKASKQFFEKAARLSLSDIITQNIAIESMGNQQERTESIQEQFNQDEQKRKILKSSHYKNPHLELSQHQPISVIDNNFPSRSQLDIENYIYKKSGPSSPMDLSWGVQFAESSLLFKDSQKKQCSYETKKIIKNSGESLLVSDFVNSKQISNAFVGYPQQLSVVSQEYSSRQFNDLK